MLFAALTVINEINWMQATRVAAFLSFFLFLFATVISDGCFHVTTNALIERNKRAGERKRGQTSEWDWDRRLNARTYELREMYSHSKGVHHIPSLYVSLSDRNVYNLCAKHIWKVYIEVKVKTMEDGKNRLVSIDTVSWLNKKRREKTPPKTKTTKIKEKSSLY